MTLRRFPERVPGQRRTPLHTGQPTHIVGILSGDDQLQASLGHRLSQQGLGSSAFKRTEQLLSERDRLDVILLDMDGLRYSGLDVVRRVRRLSEVPIVAMSKKSDERSVVQCLTLGSDDYVTKPLRMAELLARVDTQVRRRRSLAHRPVGVSPKQASRPFDQPLTIDRGRRTVHCNGELLDLTTTEFAIVECLCEVPGLAVSREALMMRVWGHADSGRSLDVHVTRVRRKLGGNAAMLSTIRGYGYSMMSPGAVEVGGESMRWVIRSDDPTLARGTDGRTPIDP